MGTGRTAYALHLCTVPSSLGDHLCHVRGYIYILVHGKRYGRYICWLHACKTLASYRPMQPAVVALILGAPLSPSSKGPTPAEILAPLVFYYSSTPLPSWQLDAFALWLPLGSSNHDHQCKCPRSVHM
jgi:hypothetical protein